MIMQRSGPPGELRHHCAVGEDGLYLIGVWQSEELLRSRFASAQFRAAFAAAGFPPMESVDISVLRLHAIEPPL
jgi:hypothetical protein